MNCFGTRFAACLTLGAVLLTTNAAHSAQYALDKSHTSILFGISHLGYSYTYGRFNDAEGKFTWDNANPAASSFQLLIKTASIDSNDKARDDHLRNADFFNASQFPHITFVSTKVEALPQPGPSGQTHNVTGNLTMHGVTKQIVLPLKKLGEGKGPFGKYRTGFSCQTTLKRSEFGMTNMLPNIGDEVAVTISFEGLRQGADGSGSAKR